MKNININERPIKTNCFPKGLDISKYELNSTPDDADKILKYPKITNTKYVITIGQSNKKLFILFRITIGLF